MEKKTIDEIDGRVLYYAFRAGGNKILQYQEEINKINVFPVNDKDTGTNLASTIRSVFDGIRPEKSFKRVMEHIAENALFGARGNSGIIFAQWLYGMSCETPDRERISLTEFAALLRKSIPYMYEAVAQPVEGTLLTVVKDWAAFVDRQHEKISDFGLLFTESRKQLAVLLERTKQQLKALEQKNLVDAGAKGFVVFVEGITELIESGHIRQFNDDNYNTLSFVHAEEYTDDEIKHRFCTEAILRNMNIPKKELQEVLKQEGDSVVVAGSESLCRIHVHHNNPSELFFKLKNYGTITYQKADDMIRQNDAVTRRKWNIALVTDSTCDLSQELIDYYQIYMLPLNINFGENHYLDKVTITPDHFYDLLDSSPDFPKTSQINERSFINLYSHLASHYDAILSVHLTSHFSGTYNSSLKAAQKIRNEFRKPIISIDSATLSGALGLLTLRIAQAIEEGWSVDRIAQQAEKWKRDAKIYVSVQDLKYMIRGGRVSKNKGFIARLLGINPIVSMDHEGKSVLFGQTFSQKANMRKVIKHIRKISQNQIIRNYIVLHAHNRDGAEEYVQKMTGLTGKAPVSVVDISPVIGMNAGNGTIAVALLFD